ncbi:MerR family transcriptional regulator [Nonomuraea sp. NBC_01738]|uniref:MerR family transcriptional regulator n=1 Tax=Nonomuraea sp. NBC_01738 TaxID=2976003 RepID=UPI002E14B6B7|nr:MerR family transcriptional regulator [Nonomuraea sp. NBC_01738]
MDGERLYTIGDLARRTGLTVKTIRFYSDQGLVPPVDRSPAGYRLYDLGAVARLDLVRTLRELGVDLGAVRRVLAREVTLRQVVDAHAEALEVQMRTLRVRRAVLSAVARRGAGLEEMELMHKLARLSEEERARLVGEFLDEVFAESAFAGIRRNLTPELPQDASAEQVEAWVELAELAGDPGFREVMRVVIAHHAADFDGTLRRDIAARLREVVEDTSLRPDELVARAVEVSGLGSAEGLLGWVEAVGDPRRERYLELLAVINEWAAPESFTPVLDRLREAIGPEMSASG